MKRVILLIGIMVVGLFAEGEIQAQRRSNDSRNNRDKNKVEKRNDDRKGNDDRKKVYNTSVNRNGRTETVVKKVVVRNNGYRYSDSRSNSGWTRVNNYSYDYDYDFRNGSRNRVYRSSAPSSRHIWVNGYWEYDRRLRRDVWVSGHWTVRRDYHRWQDGRYSVMGGVRVWVPGVWIRIF
tara:strand:- start:975 stop:1511 length:537 start_codon:yes stop_codon:yes gene_type:complete